MPGTSLAPRTTAPVAHVNFDRSRKSIPELTKILTSVLGDADRAIKAKLVSMGGVTGKAVGPVEFAKGDGFRQKFANGTMFVLPPNAPFWVQGAILAEYDALGAEGGFLGYPITDERATPDNLGRYNHFQNGSIYWSYDSGAHEVHGAIRDKWASLGWERGWLGFPIAGERGFTEGGIVARFQHGAIYWWEDTGAIELGDVSVRYKGLYCFGETAGGGSDEPYVLMGVVGAPADSPPMDRQHRSQIYGNIDSGDEHPDDIELYRGPPYGLAIGSAVMEHDEGDPDSYLTLIKAGVELAGEGVAKGCGALFGAEAAPICETVWDAVAPKIVSTLNDLAGTGDDLIGKTNLHLSAKQLILCARLPWNRFWGIRYHAESELISDGDASYKVYFSVDPA